MEQVNGTPKLVVGVDGSDGNLAAVKWAVDEARDRGASLIAVYAWHIPTFAYSAPYFVPVSADEMSEQGRKILDAALTEAGADTADVDLRVVEGNTPGVIRNIASEPAVDLVVVGSRGRRSATDLLLGSTSHSLSHECPKPLVIVPTAATAPTHGHPVRHIVVGTDGSSGADAAVAWAAQEARRTDSVLELVVAWTWTAPFFPLEADLSVPIEESLRKAAEETLGRTDDRLDLHGLTVKRTVREGAAADALVDQSREAGMLVVGRRGLGVARELFLGSVSHACTHRSVVPIVVVPRAQS